MDVNLISSATENLLVSSLRSAITDVNAGMNSNDALVKRATENALGPELACRLTEAYNTSKTLNKLRNTEGEKRAESFDLANRDTVLAALYTPAEPTEKVASVANDPRKINFNNRPKAYHEKAAAVGKLSLGAEYTKQALYGIEGNAVIAGRGFLNGIKNARDEFRMHIKRAKEDVAKSLHEFVSTFKRADRNKMSPLKDIEERLSFHFGPIAKQAMDLACGQLNDKQRFEEKRAEEVPTSYVHPLNDELYKLAETLITDLQAAGDLQAEYMTFDKKASSVEKHFKHQVDAIAGRVPHIQTDSVLNEEQQMSPILSKMAADFDPTMSTVSSDPYEVLDDEAAVQAPAVTGMTKKKKDPSFSDMLSIEDAKPVKPTSTFPAQHEGALRAIKTKMMLNDMISNDPVISGYPVEQVTGVYNKLAELVPALSTQPIAMRGLIANMLQREGGLESMEVKNLLDTEESKRKLRVLGD